jgi:hypothetical protein
MMQVFRWYVDRKGEDGVWHPTGPPLLSRSTARNVRRWMVMCERTPASRLRVRRGLVTLSSGDDEDVTGAPV